MARSELGYNGFASNAYSNMMEKVVPALAPRSATEPIMAEAQSRINEVGDDRDHLEPGMPLLLIVENDLPFAKLLLETARERGFRGLVTSLGASALAMVREYAPDAVTLDLCLPDIDGWRVLERLKNDFMTRHIPVTIISTEESRDRALKIGAWNYVAKPIQTKETLDQLLEEVKSFLKRPSRNLLVAEPDAEERQRLADLLGLESVNCTAVSSESEARNVANAADRLHGPQSAHERPVRRPVDRRAAPGGPQSAGGDHRPFRWCAARGDGSRLEKTGGNHDAAPCQSTERLLDHCTFFLHTPMSSLPAVKSQMVERLYQNDQVLAGKKVLIVDDDIRNIFALSSVLEWHNMAIASAETGRNDHHAVLLQDAGQGEDVAHIVIDDQHLLLGQDIRRGVQRLQDLALRLGQLGDVLVHEQAGLIQEPLRRRPRHRAGLRELFHDASAWASFRASGPRAPTKLRMTADFLGEIADSCLAAAWAKSAINALFIHERQAQDVPSDTARTSRSLPSRSWRTHRRRCESSCSNQQHGPLGHADVGRASPQL